MRVLTNRRGVLSNGSAAMTSAKRTRAEAAPHASGEDAVSGLASWCDDRLRLWSEKANDLADQSQDGIIESLDNEFDDMLEEMGEEMQIQVPEPAKGQVAEKWRAVGCDARRVWALQAQMREAARETYSLRAHAQTALSGMLSDTEESFDLWFFNLGWELANCVLANGGEEVKSESGDSDEPADESDSEDEEEGEEEDSESGSESDDSDD